MIQRTLMSENQKPSPDTRSDDEPLSPAEIVGWLEFGCWTMVALAPFLYWVNGPAVSTDQLVVRTGLVIISLLGGTIIRVTKLVRRRKERQRK
jgi:hypothetical protein